MIGKASVHRPTALGTLLSSGAYGATIADVYGTPRLPPMPIWAANLREGHSGKKFKSKKGAVAFVENINMMVGSNPILNVLQIWSNQQNEYPLDFKAIVVDNAAGGSWHGTQDLSTFDAEFFHLCAVTSIVGLAYDPITFNDYGAAGPNAYAGSSGGGGQNFYEFPLWNRAEHGPNLTDPQATRFPSYYWTPAMGAIVELDFNYIYDQIGSFLINNPTRPLQAPFIPTFFLHFYYAALSAKLKHVSPMVYNRFTFENQLGNDAGGEYSSAGATAQQIIYPMYAGVGSPDMDLGTSGSIPSWRFEVQGAGGFLPSNPDPLTGVRSTARSPRADAEFADIVEAVLRSGMKQYGAALGYIGSGCGCYELPGTVQKNWFQNLLSTAPVATFNQPNTGGSILLAVSEAQSAGSPLFSDSPANTWVSLLSGNGLSVGYVNGCIANTGRNTVASSVAGSACEIYIMEFDPGSQAVGATNVAAGTGIQTATITTTADLSYVVAAIPTEGVPSVVAPVQWQRLFPGAPLGRVLILARTYHKAGTVVTMTSNFGASAGAVVLFEVKSAQAAGTVPYPKTLADIIDYDTLFNVRMACRCGDLQGSLAMDSQKSASDWLSDLYMCMNAWPVWSGSKLKSIARSEVSQIGNGTAANTNIPSTSSCGFAALYYAPTSTGPIVDLTVNDFIGDSSKALVSVARKQQPDRKNIYKIQSFDRQNKYNQATISEPITGAIATGGSRPTDPKTLPMVMDPQVARKIAAIEGRRLTMLPELYSFSLRPNFLFLEAGDLVTITEPLIGLFKQPVRLLSVKENENMELECTAEKYIYALHAPQILPATALNPYHPDLIAVPASVNAPIFIEPPAAMTAVGAFPGNLALWIPISDSDPNYGGCIVNVSTDGGLTYQVLKDELGQSVLTGNATTGQLTQDWPPSADPDFTNDLKVDLTESLGTLPNISTADENNFVFPCFVEGATTCAYELGCYSAATLTAAHKYTLPASPNGLRRAVYHQPISGAVDHPFGKRFAFLGAVNDPSPAGIFKTPLQPIWIGQTLFFKFQAFNLFGMGIQDLSACTAYSYIPGGCALIVANDVVQIPITSPAPGNFTIPHGLAYTPAFVTVQMTSDGDIVLQSPLGFDGTNVYLNASDTGLTAIITLWPLPADANIPLAPGVGGNFTMPHGLAGTPTLSIVQMNSLADIWKQSTPYTSSNVNLIASDGGITGIDYVWRVPPRTASLTRFASIALAPGAGGSFTVPHGLGVVPKMIIVRMSGAAGGRIWLQNAAIGASGDTTNLLLVASDGGIVGEAEVWA